MHEWQSILYRLGIITLAAVSLIVALNNPTIPVDWVVVGIFTLVSLVTKRAGFRIVADVTHSLVNVVDVAALLLTGPLGGAIVAGLSSAAHLEITYFRRGTLTWRTFFDLPVFDSAVKVLMALLSGAVFLQLGGVLRPTALLLDQFVPLAALFVIWVALDHFLWALFFWFSRGPTHATDFLRRIWRRSLLIEFAPLPFALPIAVAWDLFNPPLRLLMLAVMITFAVIVRAFVRALDELRTRIETVSLLNKFGQSLLLAQLDEDKVLELLYENAARLLPDSRFELLLLEDFDDPKVVLPAEATTSTVLPLMPQIVPLLVERPRARLLPELSPTALENEGHRTAAERPATGSVLLIPLMAGEDLLGLFVAQSRRPFGLTLDDGRSLSILATQATAVIQNARNFRQEQWRVRQLATIAEVSRLVASVIKLDDLLWQVADLIQRNFRYYHVQIYLVESETNEVVYRAGSKEAGRELAKNPARLQVGKEGIIGWVAGEGEPLLVPDVSKEPRYIHRSQSLLPDVRSELAIPLKIEDRVLGVLDVQSRRVNALDADDVFTLSTLGDQLAIAIEEAQLYVAQRETAWVTTGLLQVAEALNPLFDLKAIMERVVRISPPLLGVEGTLVYLWNQADKTFEYGAMAGIPEEIAAMLRRQRFTPDDVPLFVSVQRWSRTVTVETEARREPRLGLFGRMLEGHGLVIAPLQSQGESLGVFIAVTTTAPPRLSDRRMALLAGVAQQAAVAIQAAELHAEQAESAAITQDLLQVAEMIASRADLGQVLEMITRLTVTLAGVRHCAVYSWDDDAEIFTPRASFGFTPEIEEAWKGTVLAAKEIPALAVLYDSSEPIPLAGRSKQGQPEQLCRLFDCPWLVGVPLRARETFLGLLVVDVTAPMEALPTRLRVILTGLARQLSIALENQALYEEAIENERRSQELLIARRVQTALLPAQPDIPGYEIAGYWRPAREVGGDFYDFVGLSGGRLAFSIADVADKGMGAALFMVLTRTALRESLWNEEDAGRALTRSNAVIAGDIQGGMFLTTFLAILNPHTGQVQAANAGHLPPFIYRAQEGAIASLRPRTLPMGILPDTQYDPFEFMLEPDDFIVMITDGLPDAMNVAGELLGLQRIAEMVYDNSHLTAENMVALLRDAAVIHAEGTAQVDDLTLVVIRRLE